MKESTNRRIVFAGGPGAGKTTVLDALAARGCCCVADTARAIIRRRITSGLSPRPPPVEFARNIFDVDVSNYRNNPDDKQPVFFDRGVVDALGMLASLSAIANVEVEAYLRQFPYNTAVFLFPPWQDIYTTDSERDQTYQESVDVYTSIGSWYSRCGYQLVEVPVGDVEARVQFVERVVHSLG